MKKIYQLFVITAFIFAGLDVMQAQAPQFYNGTSGTSSNAFPLNSTTSNHVQWVYGPNLFASGGTGSGTPAFAGNIVKVYFRIGGTANSSATYTNFTISLGQNIGTQTTWINGNFSTTLTTCFTQASFTTTGAATNTWYGVVLQTPFQYDPSQSLIFDMKVQSGTGNTVAQVSTTGMSQRIWGLYTATTGSFGTGLVDFGFDLVPISTAPNDAGIASVDSPASSCIGQHNLVVKVKNFGINQVDTVTVNWTLNGLAQTPVNYYQLLDTFNGAGSTSAQVLLGTITLNTGCDTVVTWTTDPNNLPDTVNDNDTAVRVFCGIKTIDSFPYFQNFENGQDDWVIAGTNSTWAFGNPAKTVINSASSGVNAFVTGGLSTGQYNLNENSYVISPCFDMTGFQGTPWTALDLWWNSEFSWDGAALQSSVDGGLTWQTIGSYLDPNNWYNDNTIGGNPGGQQSGWSGRTSTSNGSNGWRQAKHSLNQSLIGNHVRFKVAFGADGSVNDDGFAFDDFILVDFREANLGPDIISLCGNPNVTLDPGIPVNGSIAWSNGDSSSTSIVVTGPDTVWVEITDTLIDETTVDSAIVIQTAAPVINFANLIDTILVSDYITLNPNLPFNLDYNWTPGNYNFPYLLVRGSDYGVGSYNFHLDVVDSVLCEDSEDVTVVIIDITGIEDGDEGVMRIYPNPVESFLVLDLNNITAEEVEIGLFDMSGKMIYSNVYGLNGNRRIELDLSGLESGPYVVRLNTGKISKSLEIIKK